MEKLKCSPYLIQRAKWRNQVAEDRKGIDRIISFDYMGSSEFEWGSLPKSLSRIRENLDNYEVTITEMYSIFSNKYQITHILDAVTKLKLGLIKTKEFTSIKEGIYPDSTLSRYDVDFGFRIWWDIENDFFIFSHKGFTRKEIKNKLDQFKALINGTT